jgi:DNA-binding NtrC family response regulator/tetratricopeptide (TPR) repeat protein
MRTMSVKKGGKEPNSKLEDLIAKGDNALGSWNPIEATEFYTQALKRLGPSVSPDETAGLRLKRGRALSLSGALTEALEEFGTARELADDESLCLQIDQNIALMTIQLGSLDDALKLLDKLRKAYKEREDREGSLWVHIKQSSTLNAMGRTEEASKLALESLGMAKSLKNERLQAQAQLEIGWIKARQGDLAGAQNALKESLRINKAVGNQVEISSASNNLGLVLWYAGELSESLTHLNRALEIRERMGDIRMMAKVYNNIGLVHFDRGDWDTALGHFQQSLNLGKRSKDTAAIKSPLVNLGLLQAQRGDFERGLKNLRAGLRAAKSVGDRLNIARGYVYEAGIHLRRGRLESAERALRKGEQGGSELRSPLLRAETLNQRIRLNIAKGKLGTVRENLKESLEIAKKHGLKPILSEAKRLESEILRKERQLDDARRIAEDALAISLELRTPLEEALARRTLGKVCLDLKDIPEATRQLKRSTEILTALRATYYLSKNFLLMAWALEHAEDYADARTRMEDAARAFEDIGLPDSADEVRREGAKLSVKSPGVTGGTYEGPQEEPPPSFEGIIGRGPGMQEVFSMVERVAGTDASVLILGESGTGKELVSRTIHRLSSRKDEPFVTVNCAAIPETLVESELFGIAKGTATGVEKRIGRFQQADKGTLFLDEIGDMSPPVQAKILRVIEGSEFDPVGGRRPVRVNVRIVAATHKDLRAAMEAGEFREDLFHRLNVITLYLPPLRERLEDIPPLIDHFLAILSDRFGANVGSISDEARQVLMNYTWPGNVRQLENTIERGVILAQGEVLEASDLPKEITENRTELDFEVPRTYQDLLRSKKEARSLAVQRLEREFLLRALTRNNWNVSRAAQETNMDRRQFHGMMKQHAIRRPSEA